MLFFTVLMYYFVDFAINDYYPFILLLTLLVVVFSICLFALSKQPFGGSKPIYFRICTLFLLGYLIVCFQRYIDFLFGYLNTPLIRFLFTSPDLINKCALLSLAGLLSFIIGYLLHNPSVPKLKKIALPVYTPTKWLIFLLLISVFLFIYYYGSYYLTNIYSQDFLESKKGSMASYLETAIFSLIYSIFILHTKNRKEKGETLFSYIKSLGLLFHISLFTFLGLFFLTGDRGFIIRGAAVYFFAYIIKVRPKINLPTILILILIASFSVTIIGIVRNKDLTLPMSDRIISTITEKEFDRSSIFNSTAELSTSVRCLHSAVDYVPERHSFLYGYFQISHSMLLCLVTLIIQHFPTPRNIVASRCQHVRGRNWRTVASPVKRNDADMEQGL